MNTAPNTDGVHIELTVEGLSREAFVNALANAMGWLWEQVDVLISIYSQSICLAT